MDGYERKKQTAADSECGKKDRFVCGNIGDCGWGDSSFSIVQEEREGGAGREYPSSDRYDD